MAESPRSLPLLEFPTDTATRVEQPSTSSRVRAPNASPYKLHTENFTQVLKKVGRHHFAVYCMAGISRVGKSYTLNYFIRHLISLQENSKPTSSRSISFSTSPTNLFSWRKGTQRETVGINIWSEPYFVESNNGQKIAILLIDAQGLFDEFTTLEQNSVIFALCSLFSSVCIFNVVKKVQTDTLQNLQFFTQYANAIGQDSENDSENSETFSRLIIMVRDYDDPEEFGYGYHSENYAPKNQLGTRQNYFHKIMCSNQDDEDVPRENLDVIEALRNNCDSIGFVLHPDPGKLFRRDSLKNTPEAEFLKKTTKFVELMFSQGYLVTKKIGGSEVTGKGFIPYVKHYADICKNSTDNFPNVETIADSTAKMSNQLALDHAYNEFDENLKEFMKSHVDVSDARLDSKFDVVLNTALNVFDEITTLGRNLKIKYNKKLFEKCNSQFDSIKERYCIARDLKIEKQKHEEQSKRVKKTISGVKKVNKNLQKQTREAKEASAELRKNNESINKNIQKSREKCKALERKERKSKKAHSKVKKEISSLKRNFQNYRLQSSNHRHLHLSDTSDSDESSSFEKSDASVEYSDTSSDASDSTPDSSEKSEVRDACAKYEDTSSNASDSDQDSSEKSEVSDASIKYDDTSSDASYCNHDSDSSNNSEDSETSLRCDDTSSSASDIDIDQNSIEKSEVSDACIKCSDTSSDASVSDHDSSAKSNVSDASPEYDDTSSEASDGFQCSREASKPSNACKMV